MFAEKVQNDILSLTNGTIFQDIHNENVLAYNVFTCNESSSNDESILMLAGRDCKMFPFAARTLRAFRLPNPEISKM